MNRHLNVTLRGSYNFARYCTFVVIAFFLFLTASHLPAQAAAPLPPAIQGSTWRVIYFWSSTCPCVRACEQYSFVPLAEKYRGKIAFYAVATNGFDLSLPHKQLNNAIAAHNLPFPVLLDKDHSIAKYFDAKITPQTFVLDPAGHIVFRGMPDDSRRFLFRAAAFKPGKKGQVPESYLAKALAQAMAGKPVTETPLKEAGCSIAW
jgi:peroxiredoxin